MKKSKKTYVLLAIVLAIWGVLGYQIVSAISPDEPQPELVQLNQKFMPGATSEKDTFAIAANYRDPFLGTLPKTEKPKKIRKKVVKKPELPKKNIVYSGSVAQNGTNKRMYFITIDGQQHILSKNESVQEVHLLGGGSESIKVRYNGRTETIALQR